MNDINTKENFAEGLNRFKIGVIRFDDGYVDFLEHNLLELCEDDAIKKVRDAYLMLQEHIQIESITKYFV